MFHVTIDVAQLMLVLGVLGIAVAALCSEIVCKRLIQLVGAFTKALGTLIKLLNDWKK
jgi:hypothetical protein